MASWMQQLGYEHLRSLGQVLRDLFLPRLGLVMDEQRDLVHERLGRARRLRLVGPPCTLHRIG
eukprot:4510835-Amphidinium_carterae.1